MQLIVGDLWSELGKADYLLVTTNAQTRGDGALVMGRGAAKEAIERFPQLPFNLGQKLREQNQVGSQYAIIIDMQSRCGKTRIGAFQVKYHWREEADLNLIRASTERLVSVARKHQELRFALNFPGIGNGRLDESDVLPLLRELPDNVFVYKLPS